jgi:hypothetical protein
MATDNITSIGGGEKLRPSTGPTGRREAPRTRIRLGGLTDPDTFQGFTTHDLISGLHGVCVAIDHGIVNGATFEAHAETMSGLAQAAKVLSSILRTEVNS